MAGGHPGLFQQGNPPSKTICYTFHWQDTSPGVLVSVTVLDYDLMLAFYLDNLLPLRLRPAGGGTDSAAPVGESPYYGLR